MEYAIILVESPAELVLTTFGPDNPEGQPLRRFYERLGFRAAEPALDGPDGGTQQTFRCTVRLGCAFGSDGRSL
jgi:hypothetical protein